MGARGRIAALALLTACGEPAMMEAPVGMGGQAGTVIRVATFNVALYRDAPGELLRDLQQGDNRQLASVQAIIRRVDPDILVLNEFDYDASGEALALFARQLEAGYAHHLAIPSNTGVASGFDLDGDGRSDHPMGARAYGNDSFGYGTHPGQYAFAVLSRFPLDTDSIRTFQTFLWKDLPDNLLPTEFYARDVQEVFRLSSKNHADVPVMVGDETLHLVLAHPTPPGFDGPEDRNGRRNHDEVRLLLDYVTRADAAWIVDDQGRRGGLDAGAMFVIAGDLNADPADGDRPAGQARHAIAELIGHPRVTDPKPKSFGGLDAARRQGKANARHDGDPALDTADFSDDRAGNLRVDYVLPSSNLDVRGSGVFWPADDEPGFELVGPGFPPVSSDHRLVWVDIALPGGD